MHKIERLSSNLNFADMPPNAPVRIIRDKGPSTRDSTERWVSWNKEENYLGQPFNVNTIPISKLEQMQRDPILAFGLMFIKVPLVRAPWYIQSEDAQRAAFVDGALRRIYGRLILAYTNSLAYGYSPMVKNFELFQPDWRYREKDDPNSDEKEVWTDKTIDAVVWKPFTALNPRFASPSWTATGDFNGIDYAPIASSSIFNYLAPENSKTNIPLNRSLWATNEKDSVFGSIYGYPRLGYAYRFWWSYWYKFGLADRAYEKWADPPVMVFHPAAEGIDANGDEVNFSSAALATAEQIRSGANVAIPTSLAMSGMDERGTNVKEWDIQQLESKANFDALDSMFKYLDIQKLRSVMVPEQALIEGNSSARNTAQAFGDIFQESQAIIMQEIDDMINRYMIPQLLELNFGEKGASCTKITTGFDPQDVETMRGVIQSFANSDATLLPIDLRDTLEKLGIKTLSNEAYKEHIEFIAENAQKMAPPVVKPQNGNAGIDSQGLYYQDGELVEFSDNERSTMRRVFDKIFGRDNEREVN